MKVIYSVLFFLLLTISGICQPVLIENFNRFIPSEHSNPVGIFVFDSTYTIQVLGKDSVGIDISTAGNNLGWGNGSSWETQFENTSILNSGGDGLSFNGTSDYWASSGTGGEAAFDMGVSSFTVQVWFNFTGTHGKSIVCDKQHSGSSAPGWLFEQRSGGIVRYRVSDGTNDYGKDVAGFSTGNTHLALVVDRSSSKIRLYKNGAKIDSVSITTLLTIDNIYSFFVGRYGDSAGYFDGDFYAVSIHKSVLSDREIQEDVFLADGWVSKNGGAVRSGYGFNQGIVNDTVYYNTALTAGGWSITLSDSAASGVNYEVLTSADATTWTTLASGTTGTSWGSKSYSGAGTGYVAIAVASGTAYFDDFVVTLASDDKNGFGGFSGRYKGWGKY